MPIYEFRCGDCNRLTSIFLRSVSSSASEPICAHCGGGNMARALSKFGIGRTVQAVVDQYGDPSVDPGSEYRDPRQIGLWAEKKFQEYGMEMPEEAREMIDAAREGEFPKPLDEP